VLQRAADRTDAASTSASVSGASGAPKRRRSVRLRSSGRAAGRGTCRRASTSRGARRRPRGSPSRPRRRHAIRDVDRQVALDRLERGGGSEVTTGRLPPSSPSPTARRR
jgi:hypothetical protein